MFRAVHPQEFLKMDVNHWHFCMGFPFHFSLFVASWLNLWRWWHVWSDCHLLRQSSRGHGWLLCQAGGWDCIGCTVIIDGGHTLLDSEAPPWLVFGDWAISAHYEVLWFAVFLSEKLDRLLSFACWPFLTVLFQVFWQECLTEMLESVWVPFPLLGLLECQLAYLQYWVLCLPHHSLHPFVSFVASWSGLQGFSMALKYALTCSIFCLVCIGGSLTWTSWSQWVCPWWFPLSLTLSRSAHCPT